MLLLERAEDPVSLTLSLVSKLIFKLIILILNLSERIAVTCSSHEEVAQARNLGIVAGSSLEITMAASILPPLA